jgi:hypothetical protein
MQSPKQIGDSTEKDLVKQKAISKKGSSWIAPDLHLEESNMTFEKMGQEALPDEGKEVSLVSDGDMWTEGVRKNRGDVGLLISMKGEVGEQGMKIDGALQGVGGTDSNRQQRAEFQQGGESQDDELNEEQGSSQKNAELCGESRIWGKLEVAAILLTSYYGIRNTDEWRKLVDLRFKDRNREECWCYSPVCHISYCDKDLICQVHT